MKTMPAVLAFVLIALAIPLILQKVPPNPFYGFRLPKTQSDPRIWYAANRAAGVNLAIAGAVSLSIWTAVALVAGTTRANVVGTSLLGITVLSGFALSLAQLYRM